MAGPSSSLASPTPACDPRGRMMIGNVETGRDTVERFGRLRGLQQAFPIDRDRRGNFQSFDALQQAVQLVAIEISDQSRRIEKRPRPARRHGLDLAQRLAAILGVRRDHDGDVVIGQRVRQFHVGKQVERRQFDRGPFQKEFDRRVAAEVGLRGEREDAKPRVWRRAGVRNS